MFTFCIRLLCSAMTLNNSEEWSDEIWSSLTESAVTKNCSYSKCWLSKVPSSPIPAEKIKGCVQCYKCSPSSNTLCSRNFQKVKLRLDFVEIWSFHRHSDFTWNPIMAISKCPKMSFLPILVVLNFDFSKFEQLSSPKFEKIQYSESLKLPKMTFIDLLSLH